MGAFRDSGVDLKGGFYQPHDVGWNLDPGLQKWFLGPNSPEFHIGSLDGPFGLYRGTLDPQGIGPRVGDGDVLCMACFGLAPNLPTPPAVLMFCLLLLMSTFSKVLGPEAYFDTKWRPFSR